MAPPAPKGSPPPQQRVTTTTPAAAAGARDATSRALGAFFKIKIKILLY
jgi:hypothetical protein